MGSYRDAELFAAMDAEDAGYHDGTQRGMSIERHRLAGALGVVVDTLVLLDSPDEQKVVGALAEISVAVTTKLKEALNG
jgi:hypothetical protein